MAKQLYVALNEAMYPVITCDPSWVNKRKITEGEALDHVTAAGLAKVYAGEDIEFTQADQSYSDLVADGFED